MKYRILWALALIMVLGMGSVASAQSAPPDESPLDNACYAGGSLAGKCDWPTDAEDEWAWTCGWYIARAEIGTLTASQVPNWCGYFVATSGCYNISVARFIELLLESGFDLGLTDEEIEMISDFPLNEVEGFMPDVKLVGPLGTHGNAWMYESMNWSCTGEFMQFTIIDFPGITIAGLIDEDNDDLFIAMQDACEDASPGSSFFPLSIIYNVPLTWLGCVDAVGPCGCGPMGALPERREVV